MTRNMMLRLLCMIGPALLSSPLAADEAERCIALYQSQIDEMAGNLLEAEVIHRRGWRDAQPNLTGLDAVEERYNLLVRDPHGQPRYIARSRWHYVDEDGKQVTKLDLVDIDREAWQARVDTLRRGLTILWDGYPARVARCRRALTDDSR